MYTQVWTKYLPIIRILLKRAINTDQTLDMNRIDFERAGSGRKAGYKFTIEFTKGRVGNVISGIPLASDLAAVLLQDDVIKDIFRKNDYKISLNTKFQLAIKYFPVEPPIPGRDEDDLVETGSDENGS